MDINFTEYSFILCTLRKFEGIFFKLHQIIAHHRIGLFYLISIISNQKSYVKYLYLDFL